MEKTLLIIEDDVSVLPLLKRVFEDHYHLHIANNGHEGLTLYRQNKGKIDIILTDMRMPGMHGTEIIKFVKAGDTNTKIVVLTANLDDAIGCGADAILGKPVNVHFLIATLESLLSETQTAFAA
jgi:two-component system OmpR family response regulator